MAHCPKCKENWFWDWEQDCYRYVDGTEVEETHLDCIEKGMELETIVYKCKCGSINSLIYNDENRGSSLCNIKEWKNVDWELDGHAWDRQCKDCKDIFCLNDYKDYKDYCGDINTPYKNMEN